MKLRTLAAFAASVLTCAGAHAAPLKPGAYSANGYQTICLYKDGTWNSSTYANWGGYWGYYGSNTHIWGNFSLNDYAGYGNDSFVVKSPKLASWTEWTDDYVYEYLYDPATFARLGSLKENGCTEGASRARPSNLPPAAHR